MKKGTINVIANDSAAEIMRVLPFDYGPEHVETVRNIIAKNIAAQKVIKSKKKEKA